MICLCYVNPAATQHAHRVVRRLRQHPAAACGSWSASGRPAPPRRTQGSARSDRRGLGRDLAGRPFARSRRGCNRNRPKRRRARPETPPGSVANAEQPLGLGQVLGAVGVEERIDRIGREGHLDQTVAGGPDVDLADAFLDHRRAQFVGQTHRPQPEHRVRLPELAQASSAPACSTILACARRDRRGRTAYPSRWSRSRGSRAAAPGPIPSR